MVGVDRLAIAIESNLLETGEEEEGGRKSVVVDEAVLNLEDLGSDGREVLKKSPESLGRHGSSASDGSKRDEEREEARPGCDEVFFLFSFLWVLLEDDLLDERSEVGRRRKILCSFEGRFLSDGEDEGVEEDGSKEGGELKR